MRQFIAGIVLIAVAGTGAIWCQAAGAPGTFEVASVKPSAPDGGGASAVRGGPGSSDPSIAMLHNIDLFSLITMAYGVRRYQVSAPYWAGTVRFDVNARIPQGATTDQYRQMLQNLLDERFRLSLHREKRELQIYDLVVGKNGPKLKESAAEPGAVPNDGLQPPPPRAGPPPGYHGPVNMTLAKMSMERFAALLSGLLDQPITNETGLAGNYDFQFRALVGSNPPATDVANTPPGILDAVQEQLGLKLAPRNELAEILVIDHLEKTPTDN